MAGKCIKLTRYLALLVVLFLFPSGCGLVGIALPETQHNQTFPHETSTSNAWMFYQTITDSDDTIQIMKKMIDGAGGDLMLEFPQIYPILALPIDELAVLAHRYCADQEINCSFEDLRMRLTIGQMHLSLDKRWLAWNEKIIGCENPSLCYGFHRLVAVNTDRPEKRVLLELPLHVDLEAEQGIDTLAWSPDNKKIAFIHFSPDKHWSRVQVIDVQTKQIVDLADGDSPLAWSPNGDNLAFGFRESSSHRTVRVVSSDGTTVTTLDDNWDGINNLDWSPDGSKLVVTASKGDIEYQFRLFVADLMVNKISEINLPLDDEPYSLTEAHWSPDGQLIGVTTSPSLVSPINGLVIFDPQDGTVKANLGAERKVERWFWSSTGNAILVNLAKAKRIGIYYWQEDRVEEIPPPSYLVEGLKNGDVSIKTPVW